MPKQVFANNAKSTLSVAVSSNTQASLTLQTGHGARFPSPLSPDYFLVTLDDGTNVEVCKCIARSGDVLTVLRGYERTTAQASFAANSTKVELRWTKQGSDFIRDFRNFNIIAQRPVIGVASIHNFGCTFLTELGTAAGQTPVNSSYRERQNRRRTTGSNSATTPAAIRSSQPWLVQANGGRFQARFGFAFAPTSSHFFIGLVGTTGAVASVHPPSSITNGIVVGYVNSGLNSNLSVWRADSAGPAVQWDLGSYFTVQTTAWYELEIETGPNDGNWKTTVRRLDISSIADVSTTFNTSVPNSRSFLSPFMHSVTLCLSAHAPEWGGWTLEM